MKRPLRFIAVLLLVFSQFVLAQAQSNPASLNDPAHFPARGGDIDWGLALSGGGERAASFSIGIMKALYDNGLLDKIDVISSVSGGGFASYWLFTNYYQNKTKLFGESAFSSNVFLNNTCQLQMTSDFIPSRAIIRLVSHNANVFSYYEGRIQRSFGHPRPTAQHALDSHNSLYVETPLDSSLLNFLNERIATGDAPYFILNGALHDKIDSPDTHKRLVEMTGFYVGSRDLQFATWDEIAISGAALPLKLKRLKTTTPELALNGHKLELIDAGWVDNLGAIPLIRRGIKNVIIVDSSSDSKYRFKDYATLKKLLAELKIDFCVPAIEAFLSRRQNLYTGSAVTIGLATSAASADGAPIDTKIYYIKLSRPESVFNTDDPRFQKGNRLANERDTDIARTCADCFYRCDNAPKLTSPRDLYFYLINSFDKKQGNTKFPQISLRDQSFDRETMEALIGLGDLEASELSP